MDEVIGTVMKVTPSKLEGKEIYHLKDSRGKWGVLIFESGRFPVGSRIIGRRVSIQELFREQAAGI